MESMSKAAEVLLVEDFGNNLEHLLLGDCDCFSTFDEGTKLGGLYVRSKRMSYSKSKLRTPST